MAFCSWQDRVFLRAGHFITFFFRLRLFVPYGPAFPHPFIRSCQTPYFKIHM